MELTTRELKNVMGGAITATLVSAIVKGVNTFLDLGRTVGTAIRRIGSGSVCSL